MNVAQCSDGGYIVSTPYPLLVFKISSTGELEWSKEIDATGIPGGYKRFSKTDMKQSPDGSVIITGWLSGEAFPVPIWICGKNK